MTLEHGALVRNVALVHCRTWEITDALVTLLLRTVDAIEARADRRVTKQLVAEFKRVQGKENLLFRVSSGRHGAAGGVPGRHLRGAVCGTR